MLRKIGLNIKRKSSSRGQATVEFALILPVVLTLLLGTIELGYLAHNHLTMANAAREGARAAAVGKVKSDVESRISAMVSGQNLTVTPTLEYFDEDPAVNAWVQWTDAYPANKQDASANTVNGIPSSYLIRVTVQSPHQQLTNFLPYLNQLTITQYVVMRREPS